MHAASIAIRLLFVGNSLTAANNLPATVAAMGRAAGMSIECTAVAKPNFSLEDHWADGDARRAIARGGWTYVILQQGPSALPESRVLLNEYVGRFDEDIRRVRARTALFMVWPSLARSGDFAGVSASYAGAASLVRGAIFPAGDAWRGAWAIDRSLALYGPDGFHPSPLGSYLAALVIFRGVTGRLPPASAVSGLAAHDLDVVRRAAAASPQSHEPATLARAIAAMQQKKDAEAVALLDEITRREPRNATAWRNLGLAHQHLKESDKAIAAYQRALAVDPANPTPIFSIGVAYAQKHDADHAFEWLQRAKATKKIDMTQIDYTAELAPLKTDPRFAPLRPTAADFAHPFVEDVTIIHEWDGEAAGDQFGWIARRIGDVDGDGVPDVVTSSPNADSHAAKDDLNVGRIYVYSTKTGRLLWSAEGAKGDQLGGGVEGAGDTNHDGIPDVIASTPYGGYAKVYSGRDGRVLLTLKGEAPADQFGRHCAGVGDVDGDGYADVIVGAPANNAGGKGAGRAYVFSGKDGRALLTLTGERDGDNFGSAVAGATVGGHRVIVVGAPGAGPDHAGRAYVYEALTTKPSFVVDADETGTAFGGMFVAVPGDMDGDGTPDVYVSDWQNAAHGPATGRVYVYSGEDGHRLFALTGEHAGDGFGTSSSVAGDVDHDGVPDLIVGAWQYSGAAVSGGRAYLYSGKQKKIIRTYTNRTPGDTFGFDAVALGDVDGDGTIDLLITSGWSGIHGFHSGRVFVISSGSRSHPSSR